MRALFFRTGRKAKKMTTEGGNVSILKLVFDQLCFGPPPPPPPPPCLLIRLHLDSMSFDLGPGVFVPPARSGGGGRNLGICCRRRKCWGASQNYPLELLLERQVFSPCDSHHLLAAPFFFLLSENVVVVQPPDDYFCVSGSLREHRHMRAITLQCLHSISRQVALLQDLF